MGKIEGLRHTMKTALPQGRRSLGVAAAQAGLGHWRRHCTHARPHESLTGAFPPDATAGTRRISRCSLRTMLPIPEHLHDDRASRNAFVPGHPHGRQVDLRLTAG